MSRGVSRQSLGLITAEAEFVNGTHICSYFCLVVPCRDGSLAPHVSLEYPPRQPAATPDGPAPPCDAAEATPSLLPHFAFPSGVCTPCEQPRSPAFHAFVLTDQAGARRYGAVLTVYQRPERQWCYSPTCSPRNCYSSFCQRARAALPVQPEEPTLADRKHRKAKTRSLYVPKALVLLSGQATVSAMKNFLLHFYTRQLSHGDAGDYLAHLMFEVPVPLPGTTVVFACGDNSIRFTCPLDLPLLGVHLGILFELLPVEEVVRVLKALLLEQRVMVLGDDWELLTTAVESVAALLYPLHWSHVYVPLMPRCLMHCLEAPVPFLVGVHLDLLKSFDDVDALNDVVVVNLLTGMVDGGESLPELVGQARLIAKMNQTIAEQQPEPWEGTFPETALRLTVAEHLALALLDGYASFLQLPSFDGDLATPTDVRAWLDLVTHPNADMLDIHGLVCESPASSAKFLHIFYESQMFAYFLDHATSSQLAFVKDTLAMYALTQRDLDIPDSQSATADTPTTTASLASPSTPRGLQPQSQTPSQVGSPSPSETQSTLASPRSPPSAMRSVIKRPESYRVDNSYGKKTSAHRIPRTPVPAQPVTALLPPKTLSPALHLPVTHSPNAFPGRPVPHKNSRLSRARRVASFFHDALSPKSHLALPTAPRELRERRRSLMVPATASTSTVTVTSPTGTTGGSHSITSATQSVGQDDDGAGLIEALQQNRSVSELEPLEGVFPMPSLPARPPTVAAPRARVRRSLADLSDGMLLNSSMVPSRGEAAVHPVRPASTEIVDLSSSLLDDVGRVSRRLYSLSVSKNATRASTHGSGTGEGAHGDEDVLITQLCDLLDRLCAVGVAAPVSARAQDLHAAALSLTGPHVANVMLQHYERTESHLWTFVLTAARRHDTLAGAFADARLVASILNLKTGRARGRAFLRLAIERQALGAYFRQLLADRELVEGFFSRSSILRQRERLDRLFVALDSLTETRIDCFSDKSYVVQGGHQQRGRQQSSVYVAHVFTGDVFRAGTQEPVRVRLHGDTASSDWLELEPHMAVGESSGGDLSGMGGGGGGGGGGGVSFSRGRCLSFALPCAHLGPLFGVSVDHDTVRSSSIPTTPSSSSLSLNSTLSASTGTVPTALPSSALSASGKGNGAARTLPPSTPLSSFLSPTLSASSALSAAAGLAITTAISGQGWMLEKIVVEHTVTERLYVFPHNQWVATGEECTLECSQRTFDRLVLTPGAAVSRQREQLRRYRSDDSSRLTLSRLMPIGLFRRRSDPTEAANAAQTSTATLTPTSGTTATGARGGASVDSHKVGGAGGTAATGGEQGRMESVVEETDDGGSQTVQFLESTVRGIEKHLQKQSPSGGTASGSRRPAKSRGLGDDLGLLVSTGLCAALELVLSDGFKGVGGGAPSFGRKRPRMHVWTLLEQVAADKGPAELVCQLVLDMASDARTSDEKLQALFINLLNRGVEQLIEAMTVIAGARVVARAYKKTALLRQAKVLGRVTSVLQSLDAFSFDIKL